MASLTDFRQRLNGGNRSNKNAPVAAVADTAGPYTALLPSVNLLPAVFAQRQANRGLIRRFIWAGVAAVLVMSVIFGARYVVQFFQASELANLQNTGATYTRQVQSLAPYKNYKDGIATERSTLSGVLQNDLDMSKILSTLNSQAARNNVSYTAIGLTVGTGGSCISDPFGAQPTVGCITLSGNAQSQGAVSNFFSQLNSTKGFLNAVPASLSASNGATSGSGGYSFNGSVSFNEQFYSNKYSTLGSDIDSALGGGTATTGTTATLSSLKAAYPTLFASTTDAQATTFATQVCAAAISGVSAATINAAVTNAGKSINVIIPSADANGVARTAVAVQCANQLSYIPGGNS